MLKPKKKSYTSNPTTVGYSMQNLIQNSHERVRDLVFMCHCSSYKGRDSAVGVATGCELDEQGVGV
jgi:hypothetical protein